MLIGASPKFSRASEEACLAHWYRDLHDDDYVWLDRKTNARAFVFNRKHCAAPCEFVQAHKKQSLLEQQHGV